MNNWGIRILLASVAVLAVFRADGFCADDLKSCYNLAIKQDPQLRGAYYRTEATKETLRQAWGRFFPVASFDLSFNKTWQDIIKSENSVEKPGRMNFFTQAYTAQLTLPIFHADYFAQLSQAKTTRNRSEEELEAARQDLVVRLTDSYLAILAAKDNIRYLGSEELAVKIHYDFAYGRYKRGLAPLTDLEDAMAKLAAIKADMVEAEKNLDVAIQVLWGITGTTMQDISVVKSDINYREPDPNNVERWVAEGEKNNSALKTKRLEAEEAQKEIGKQRAGHYPYVDLQSHWNRNDTGGSVYGGGSLIDTVDAGIRMTIPIFSGGIVNSKVRESVANYQRVRQDVTKQERQMTQQVHESFYGMKSSISRVTAFTKSVESQSLVLEARQRGFAAGLNSSVEVLDAAKDLHLYQKNLSKAKYEYILNYVKLRQASGSLGDDVLELVNSWFN